MTELVEEHDYDTLDEALATGVRLWDQQRYFEAHECLEDVWHQAEPDDREFWKGVIQVAVGCVHHQRGNADGCVTLLRRAADYLDPYPDIHHGVAAASLRRTARTAADRVEAAGETIDISYPGFPSDDDGPFVGDEPGAASVPVDRTPPWEQEDGR